MGIYKLKYSILLFFFFFVTATPEDIVDKALSVVNEFLLAQKEKDNEKEQENVLYDLGCGDGRFIIAAAKKFKLRGTKIPLFLGSG